MQDKPIFVRMLGDTPKVRILNYLIRVRGLDFSMSDIARNSDVGWATLNRLWREFESAGIVVHTRRVGKAKLYKLNEGNPFVKEFVRLFKRLFVVETEMFFARHKELVMAP
ncbi:helix-turn-helix transcriptional regulator [Candidatus Woesearchaeota archaeon]|nr:helix-turn-helix transcriptional regulator [Candidatus Woesearchaeota archaeon]